MLVRILLVLLIAICANAQVSINNAVLANVKLNGTVTNNPFTFVASASGGADASGTTVATSTTLNVAAGDLIVAMVSHEDSAGGTVSATDGGSNSLTFDTGDDVVYPGSFVTVHPFYKLSASANSSATFTATFSSAQVFRRIIVFQYRPASGETVSKDISGTREATASSTAMASGTFSTTGTDNVVCGLGAYYTTWTPSTPLVAGVAASQTLQQSGAYQWCRIVAAALTTQTASVTSDQNREWAATSIAFKSQ